MLNKPADYEAAQAYGEFTPIALGGHIMRIMGVEVVTSSTGKDMLKISLDTASDDSQPAYFAAKYRADTRADKKWGCVMYQLVYDDQGATNRGFKTFITSVEESNPGFTVAWGAAFEQSLKDKRVGAIFREEEYQKQDGSYAMSTKPFAFRSVATIKEGVEIPEPKMLNKPSASSIPQSSYGNGGYKPARPAQSASINDAVGANPFFAPPASSAPPVQPTPFAFEAADYGDTLPF